MAELYPFPALMPEADVADKVATLPYDVMSRAEAKQMADGNPLSFLRISRSEIELPDDASPYTADVYELARANLERLIGSAPMLVDSPSSYYVYAMTMNGRTQYGIAGAASVDDYDNDVIKKHEKTRQDKEDDRTRHVTVTRAHTGPVLLTCRPNATVSRIMQETVQGADADLLVEAEDGVGHAIWRVPASLTGELQSAFADIPLLYIADGHHRAKSASRAREECRAANPSHSGDEAYNRFLVVCYPADQMAILAYNRVVHDLNGLDSVALTSALAERFEIVPGAEPAPAVGGRFHMYLDGCWSALVPKEDIGDDLDVAVLQDRVLAPLLGIDDPRTNKRVEFIGGIRGTGELERRVDSGSAAVAFSMYPVTVDQLMQIADAGEIMPPKSTWFEPKLRDGLLTHTF
jgi:uncharacterized protein (DUF1015 family)